MIWLLKNNLDFTSANEIRINERLLHIELNICFKRLSFGMIDRINKLPSPRQSKSHLLVGLLPSQIWTVKPKIIYHEVRRTRQFHTFIIITIFIDTAGRKAILWKHT